MFKGLKTKLEDEAKRLQATVSQYGENIAQQVRSGMSDAGSDASGHARRFFASNTVRNSPPESPDLLGGETENLDTVQLDEDNLNNSALMQEISEQDLFDETRERRNSGDSVESHESSFSNIFSSIPGIISSGQRLGTITSDVESESVTTSSQFQSASKEQISTVLHKLQGRAANYKDKYRGLVKIYNELVRENEKYRSVLTATQDKALERIDKLRQKNQQLEEKVKELERINKIKDAEEKGLEEESKIKKLQELLEKCRVNMKENKAKIQHLTEENEKLKKSVEASTDEQGISDLIVQRVTAEWKGRVDCLEEEWSKRLRESQENGTLAIAKVKAEMHRALEEKENELHEARARCKVLETNGSNVQRQIDELKATVDALENERADMVEKLSEAKQQGVKAVRCEEEEKRQKLMEELEKKRAEERDRDEKHFQELIKKNDEQWELKFKEQEEQMQLAIEEREMQKVAAVMEHDRRNDDLGIQVEQLTAEKLHLKSVLDDMKERHRRQMEELSNSIETNKERHQQEITAINSKQQEVIAAFKEELKATTESNKKLNEQMEELMNNKDKAYKGIENRNKELINELAKERQTIDDLKKQYGNELNSVNAKMTVLQKNHEETEKEKDIILGELKQKNSELAKFKEQLNEITQSALNTKKELDELHIILEQKTATIMCLESEKEILNSELASTRELSKIHQHLQEQLKVAQLERDEAEKRYSEMEERVQKAVQELEEDRRVLQRAKKELEKKNIDDDGRCSNLTEAEMSNSEAEEMICKMEQVQEEAKKAKDDLDEKVASLISESKQLQDRVQSQQEQIEKLEDEKRTLVEQVKYAETELAKQQEKLRQKDENYNLVQSDLLKVRESLVLLSSEKDELAEKLQEMQREMQKELNEKFMITEDLKSQIELLMTELETKRKQFEMVLDSSVSLQNTTLKENIDSKSTDIQNQELLLLEGEALKNSECDHAEELVTSEGDELEDKKKAIEELLNKLNLIENEKSTLLAKIEVLERNIHESEERKKELVEELEDVRESRDNLRMRMEEIEESVRETFAKNSSQMEELKKELMDKADEINNLRSSAASAENEINEKSLKLEEMLVKNEELEAMNEKLRIEFLQKESIVSELQKKMDESNSKEHSNLAMLKKNLEEEQKRGEDLENELSVTKEFLKKIKNELEEKKNIEQQLQEALAESIKKDEEERNIRDQYALALKNANDNLEEAQKQLAELDLVRIEKDRLLAELSMVKEDFQKVIQQSKQENEQRLEELNKKAEQKVLKIRKQCETDGQAAKAELLLQIDELRSRLAERDLEIEEQKINISSLEEKLRSESENEKIINNLRSSIEMLTSERDSKANECTEFEVQLEKMRTAASEMKDRSEMQSQQIASLQSELEELKAQNISFQEKVQAVEQSEREKKVLLDEKMNYEKEIEQLRSMNASLQQTANEEKAIALAKAESERQRLLRELQKEIKQLYHDLNTRTQQLDEAQAKLQELSSKEHESGEGFGGTLTEVSNDTCVGGKRLRSDSEIVDQTDYEELCALRERIAEYQRQLEEIKEAHKKEVTLLCAKASCAEHSNIIGLESLTNGTVMMNKESLKDNSLTFAEPTEAEYLRNVLYRYMNERETLGKESVTLARVIATVARFTREQVNAVVAKEEQRNYGWVGGTVHGLISSATHLSSR